MTLKKYEGRYVYVEYEDLFNGYCRTKDLEVVLGNLCKTKEDIEKAYLSGCKWAKDSKGIKTPHKSDLELTLSKNNLNSIKQIIENIALDQDN